MNVLPLNYYTTFIYLYIHTFIHSFIIIVNPLSPKGMASFSKSVTMNQLTTCDIPSERYFLKYAINHTKRNRGGHRLD